MILTPYELESYFEGDLGEFEERYVLKLIESAERRVAGLCPNARHLMESDAPDDLKIGLVRDVVATVVMRVLRDKSPGLKSENEGNYGYEKDSLTSSGNIWVSREDLAALGCGPSRGRAGTARIGHGRTFAGTHLVTRERGWW